MGVADVTAVHEHQERGLSWLSDMFGDRFRLFELDFSVSRVPNSLRFLEFPDFGADHVYICDADFLITENILEQNLPVMHQTGAPFNNVVREGTERLTGLHFTRREALWEPISRGLEVPAEMLNGNDERLLHHLVETELGIDLSILSGLTRPIPGFHISLFSRFPLGTVHPVSGVEWVGWGGAAPEKILTMLNDSKFQDFESQLTPDACLPIALARVWALASLSRQRGRLDVDAVPALTGSRRFMTKIFEQAAERQTL